MFNFIIMCYNFLQVIDGLKVGNEALKKIHDVLSVDEVERILDETREGVEKQRVCIISHLSLLQYRS
jgi:hypothetical protein